jgi:starvation-inducible DNA-binding protein
MEQLIIKMNELQATTFAFYLKAHNFHWNVRGKDFSQLHEFFGDLYAEVWGAVDTTAEQIRALGSPVAGALGVYQSQSRINDEMGVPSAAAMIFSLYYDNNTVIDVLNEAHELATINKQYGLINFIEGRLDTHKKHGWMLSASMDTPVAEQAESSTAVVEENIQEIESLTEEVKTYFLNPEQ